MTPTARFRYGTLFLAVVLILLHFSVQLAGAQTALVTDYDNYPDTPQAQLPDGCDGGGLYHSETFTLNGSDPVSDPAALPPFVAGDLLRMDWNATTPECVGAPVVLTIKIAPGPTFDPNVDQEVYVPWAGVTATGGPQSVSYELPDLAPFGKGCNYQMDAIVGIPLKVVGPSGSDYSASVRRDDKRTTVIKWRNGVYDTCEQAAPTTTVPEVPTTVTTVPADVAAEATTTIPLDVTPTEQTVPVTTTAPAAPAADSAVAAQRTLSGPLPVTGFPIVPAAGFGLLLLSVGALGIFLTNRKTTA